MITTNYGLTGARGNSTTVQLDASKHVARQQPDADGYVNADTYNRPLDAWLKPNGKPEEES